ncbi:hypothetical protein EJ06DRAFT_529152 [Trichodelitschia bisporula]|uniref:Uncharacterized protein n=1 Tax=Trichodelitschia bisporula TaxID=703511 RepID=A0A6G1I166_9PEZI|nr:hypothetical protein EJ06DRAFT_529152 [Trichodelitschia bisporula]
MPEFAGDRAERRKRPRLRVYQAASTQYGAVRHDSPHCVEFASLGCAFVWLICRAYGGQGTMRKLVAAQQCSSRRRGRRRRGGGSSSGELQSKRTATWTETPRGRGIDRRTRALRALLHLNRNQPTSSISALSPPHLIF